MREAPRQPKNLDVENEQFLAIVGQRLERWQAFRDDHRPYEEKVGEMMREVQHQLDVVDQANLEPNDPEVTILNDDSRILMLFPVNDVDAVRVCDARIAYYQELRQNFIQQL